MVAKPAGSGSGCVDPAPSGGNEAVAVAVAAVARGWGAASRLGAWGLCCCCVGCGCSGSSSTCCATMFVRCSGLQPVHSTWRLEGGEVRGAADLTRGRSCEKPESNVKVHRAELGGQAWLRVLRHHLPEPAAGVPAPDFF